MNWGIIMAWTISDDWKNSYINALKEAVSNEEAFWKFRADPRINQIFESVSEEQGASYHRAIGLLNENINLGDVLKDDDRFKKRFITEYNGHKISPNFFRYTFTALNFLKNFPEVTKIIEIGGGFGGLALIFSRLIPSVKYTIIDIPETLELQEKYLKSVGCKTDITYTKNTSQAINFFSLLKGFHVISCYALDELDKEERQYYYDYILRNSSGIYLTVSQHNVPGHYYSEEPDPVAGKILLGKPQF